MRIWRQSVAAVKNHLFPSADNAYQPRLLGRPWLLFFLALTLATEGFLVADLVARQTDQNFLAAVVPAEVIALTNTQREANYVGDVSQNALLTQAAQAKADDMAAKGYFSHTGPDGKTPWQWIAQSGYQYQYAGENLAVRFIDSADVVNAWMQSPTHRANIVKPVYTQIGVGVAQGLFEGQMATYVVQYFASPMPGAATASSAGAAPAAVAAAAAPTPAPPAGAAALPQVEGAAVAPVAHENSVVNSFTQSLSRQLTRALADPQQSAAWVLGAVALLLGVVLAAAFFMHPQIQPTTMLMSGALVAMLALSLLAVNSRITEGAPADTQSASVALSSSPGTVVIGQQGESTGYALFPPMP